MHEVIKEVKASHLGYIQGKLEALVASVVKTSDKENVFGETDSGVFNGKKQLRIFVYINNTDIWNEFINKLIEINELANKDEPDGYSQQHSTRFNKDKVTKLYTVILDTDKYSLHYKFIYRNKI